MSRKGKVKKAKIVPCSQGQGKRRRKHKPVLYDDIIFNILSRLPAMCLYGIMRRVCNTWAQFIRNPRFVELHLQHSRPGLFIQQLEVQNFLVASMTKFRSLFLEFNENGDFEVTNFKDLPSSYWHVQCSFDGLLLVHERSKSVLHVENPITKDVVEVPLCFTPHRLYLHSYGMTRLTNNGGLKLFCGFFGSDTEKGLAYFYVLTVGVDDSWRKIGSISITLPPSSRRSIVIGEFMYWVQRGTHWGDSYEVVVVDTANESISKFYFPKQHLVLGFLRVENYLSYVALLDGAINLYVSKDVHVRKWEIYDKIVIDSISSNWKRHVRDFIVCVDQNLIFQICKYNDLGEAREVYVAYNLKTRQITSLEEHASTLFDVLLVHTNSLVSCRSF